MDLHTFALRHASCRTVDGKGAAATISGVVRRSCPFCSHCPGVSGRTPQKMHHACKAWCIVSTSGRFARSSGCNGFSLHPLFYHHVRSRFSPAPFFMPRSPHPAASRAGVNRSFVCAPADDTPAASRAGVNRKFHDNPASARYNRVRKQPERQR